MASSRVLVSDCLTSDIPSAGVAVKDLRIKTGVRVIKGQAVGTLAAAEGSVQVRLKSPEAGRVEKVLIKKGDTVQTDTALFVLSAKCTHPTLMKDMCAECGADLRQEGEEGGDGRIGPPDGKAAIAMVHSIPELKVSADEAQTLGKEDEARLLKHRKLVLLVDLDQTLIHTTNEAIPQNLKDVYHFQLSGQRSPWYHTRVRPFAKEFLEAVSKLYELHICTFGARLYAHTIAGFLDPKSKYFSHRILSRDECFDSRSKTANLSSLFPCGDHMVGIIDDRKDVWNFAPNLVHIKPYVFFKNTGDVNAPELLDKRERPRNSKDEITKRSNAADEQDSDEKEDQTPPSLESEKAEKKDRTIKEPPTDADNGSAKETSKETDQEREEREHAEKEVANDLSISDDEDTMSSLPDKKDAKEDKGEKEEETASSLEDDLEVMEDMDDYLKHLIDILKTIHTAYYDLHEQVQQRNDDGGRPPDLKTVIPYVRRKTLQGVRIVFSGVDPMGVAPEKSRAVIIARGLGAKVHNSIQKPGTNGHTTHLIAARLGTNKEKEARKMGSSIHVVTPDWLWTCAERWERVDERLFPLTKTSQVTLKPPSHCISTGLPPFDEMQPPFPHIPGSAVLERSMSTGSDALPEALNPILAFSSEELRGMDDEIGDDSSSDDDDKEVTRETKKGGGMGDVVVGGIIGGGGESGGGLQEESNSSEESLSAEEPKGWAKEHKRQRLSESLEQEGLDQEEEEEEEGDDDDDEDLESMAQYLEKEVMESDY